MSLSLSVVGIIPGDEDWAQMRHIYQVCDDAGVAVPKEVLDFFGGMALKHVGNEMEVDMYNTPAMPRNEDPYTELIEVAKLDPRIKFISVTVR